MKSTTPIPYCLTPQVEESLRFTLRALSSKAMNHWDDVFAYAKREKKVHSRVLLPLEGFLGSSLLNMSKSKVDPVIDFRPVQLGAEKKWILFLIWPVRTTPSLHLHCSQWRILKSQMVKISGEVSEWPYSTYSIFFILFLSQEAKKRVTWVASSRILLFWDMPGKAGCISLTNIA